MKIVEFLLYSRIQNSGGEDSAPPAFYHEPTPGLSSQTQQTN